MSATRDPHHREFESGEDGKQIVAIVQANNTPLPLETSSRWGLHLKTDQELGKSSDE